MSIDKKLDEWEEKQVEDSEKTVAENLITNVRTQYRETLNLARIAESKREEAKKKDATDKQKSYAEKADEDLEKAEEGLKNPMKKLFEIFGEESFVDVPKADFKPKFNSNKANSLEAKYIFKGLTGNNPNHDPGSTPSQSRLKKAWEILVVLGVNESWARFHILNENLGGKGVNSNLIPMPKFINNPQYLNQFEVPLKNLYNQKTPIWFFAIVDYYDDDPEFVKEFNAVGGGMKVKDGNWVKDESKNVPEFKSFPGKPDIGKIDINFFINGSEDDWKILVNLTSITKNSLKVLKEGSPSGGYNSIQEIFQVIDNSSLNENQKKRQKNAFLNLKLIF